MAHSKRNTRESKKHKFRLCPVQYKKTNKTQTRRSKTEQKTNKKRNRNASKQIQTKNKMITIKERLNDLQEGIIDKVGRKKIIPEDKVKIKRITASVTKWCFIIFEGIGMGIIYLRIIPSKMGWPFAQTSVLLSILFVLSINFLSNKSKSL